jgi:predicted nuclease of predicted toxin-antitoxin system
MLLLAADENFNNDILRGLLRRDPTLNIVRVQDVDLVGAPDPDVLEWAAREKRVLLTHDQNTITKFAYQRVVEGKPMSGVIEVNRSVPMNVAIEDILLLAALSEIGEMEERVVYLPLR